MKSQPMVYLASKSPRRAELIKKLKRPFKIRPSGTSEETKERRPAYLVKELALRKAKAVARSLTEGHVVGADTVVVLESAILGQPTDSREAYRMLYRLGGTEHRVFTGVAVIDAETGRTKIGYAESRVRMRKLSIDELLRYSRLHHDKAGAYAIQEKNDPIARVVKGSYDNVVGLPVALVRRLLSALRSPRSSRLKRRRAA